MEFCEWRNSVINETTASSSSLDSFVVLTSTLRQPPRRPTPRSMCPSCARRAPARHAVSHSFTDLGLHDNKISTGNDSFTDHGFHDKHIKAEGFIWEVATKHLVHRRTQHPGRDEQLRVRQWPLGAHQEASCPSAILRRALLAQREEVQF
ncbi:hypothetical protein MSG28_008170 [Choristoneura fumiferana]|uniref:Uncharacterized protein n=1 Tax=Choristoneura fumiferana TaxID=7141 RepID=A0ACC0JA84_CHOFU|nr:hypothetical protein MSG28_008170 [Choristoneura fumiferana]